MKRLVMISMIALAPTLALAENPEGAKGGAASGAAAGAVGGAIVGGPVGAAVGGVGGALVGGIIGDNTPKFKRYVVQRGVPSYTYREDLRPGIVLPEEGITYYEVPEEYGVQRSYRYTVINGHPVLVEPRTRKVIQVIE